MRAVVIGAGGTELLVAVRAAGVNGADLAQRPGATRRRPAGRSTSPASRWPARS
jgi:NADPH:quinone reductase-like Zn-dependent oxidoreductase